MPKAIPSFSIKCRFNQSPHKEMVSPKSIFVLTQILRIWSKKINTRTIAMAVIE
jgi:hypothetical protein